MDHGKIPLIYLASPYTHVDVAVRQRRYENACQAVALLLKAGVFAYSPIVHTHPLTQYGLEGPWEFWRDYDLTFLKRCSELWVLTLDGWQESKGVRAEIETARSWGLPVRYVTLDDLENRHFAVSECSRGVYNELNEGTTKF
jgi:hypothetical protein